MKKTDLLVSILNMWNSLLITKQEILNLWSSQSMWDFHVK
jgi:hypothetical protein